MRVVVLGGERGSWGWVVERDKKDWELVWSKIIFQWKMGLGSDFLRIVMWG